MWMGKSWFVPRRGKSKSLAGDWNLVRVHVRTLHLDDELTGSTTLWPKLPCCPTRKPRNYISTLQPLKRDSRMSLSLLVMSMFMTLRRRASKWSLFQHCIQSMKKLIKY